MAIANSELMAILPKDHAGKPLKIGDNTIGVVHDFHGERALLSQRTAPFIRRMTELLLSPLLVDGSVKVRRAAAIKDVGFAKVAIEGNNGCDPITRSIPYLKGAQDYTDTSITLIRYSRDPMEYIANALCPGPREGIHGITYDPDADEYVVRVKSSYIKKFCGPRNMNVAMAAKLTNYKITLMPV
ncbi:MAG TPA: hypothetical protein P5244_02860 [Syntrophales bacterium]|nr:hypothetical protein [Syntrophales bacterium]